MADHILGWRARIAALTATAGLGCVPAASLAASHQVPASARVQATVAHAGSPGGPLSRPPQAIRLRVRNPSAYARAKRAAQLAAPQRSPASRALSAGGPQTAVFGGLSASGLSAAQEIAQFGDNGNVTPPDTTGAIGPSQYIEFVNREIAIYDRTSLAMEGSPVSLDTFTGGTSTCDPQIKFDPQSGRWFYVALRCDGTTSANQLYVGWSKAASPTDLTPASWCTFTVPSTPASSVDDYPKLGVDAGHIIIGSNMFDAGATGSFQTAHILIAPKPPGGTISSCGGPPAFTVFGDAAHPLMTPAGNAAFTPEPATVADGSPSTGYIVASDFNDPFDVSGSHLMLWHAVDSGGVPTLIIDGDIPVPSFSVPPPVPQPGSPDTIDSLDGRLTQAVAAADPKAGSAEAVWTQHTVSDGSGGSVVRWYEVVPSTMSVRQSGTISDAAGFAFNGAIAPTLQGGAVINYNVGGLSQTAQVKAQSRVPSAPLGGMFKPITLGSSAAADSDFSCPSQGGTTFGDTSCRWGDYAGASPDPDNPDVTWGSNQVNGPISGAGGDAHWATQIFALTPTLAPATAAFSITPNPSTPGLAVSFDGSASTTDPAATITSYSWKFGDGSTSTGVTTSHSFKAAGEYTVTLTVTDNFAQTATTTHAVAIAGPLRPAFTAKPNPVGVRSKVSFNAGGSRDPGATIASYSWNFGDGSTGTGVTTSHSYKAVGTYTATLTVTDNFGRTATTAHAIAVRPPPRGRLSIRSPQQLLVVLQRGLVVRLSVNHRSKARFVVTTPIKPVKHRKPAILTLLRTRIRTISAGAHRITLKLNPVKARTLGGAQTVIVTVRVLLTDAYGLKLTLTATVRLKR